MGYCCERRRGAGLRSWASIGCALVLVVAFLQQSTPQAQTHRLADLTLSLVDDPYVDLELVLAVDVSRSMDIDEQRLQRAGYAEALRSSEVLEAIEKGLHGRIAITYFEWAGPVVINRIIGWEILDGPESADEIASALEAFPVGAYRGTSISGGLGYAEQLLNENPYIGLRQVVDVSGDGPNNMGPPVVDLRDQLVDAGIVINGLPLMLKDARNSVYNIPDLDIYYEDCVIGGPGAFAIPVKHMDQFPEAIRRKLVLEIAGLTPHVSRAQFNDTKVPRIDCLIGEKKRLEALRLWMP